MGLIAPPPGYTDFGPSSSMIEQGIFTSPAGHWESRHMPNDAGGEDWISNDQEGRIRLAKAVAGVEGKKAYRSNGGLSADQAIPYTQDEINQAKNFLDPLATYNERFANEVKIANQDADKFSISNPVSSTSSKISNDPSQQLSPVGSVQPVTPAAPDYVPEVPAVPEVASNPGDPGKNINTAQPNAAVPELVNKASQSRKRKQTSRSLTLLGSGSDTMGSSIDSKNLLGS